MNVRVKRHPGDAEMVPKHAPPFNRNWRLIFLTAYLPFPGFSGKVLAVRVFSSLPRRPTVNFANGGARSIKSSASMM
jgi:hypothetical protein